MSKTKMTQRLVVKQYLEEGNTLTSMEAFKKFGATRLSAIIFDLRAMGYIIDSIPCVGTTRYGESCRYVMYRWNKKNKKAKK